MSNKTDNEDRAAQQRMLTERAALDDGYAALLGQQTTQSFGAYTFEEAVEAQLHRIEDVGTARRPNELDRVTQIEQGVQRAVAVLKETPPEQFLEADADQDVNTEEG